MSILGLYNWDPTVLDPMVLPEGIDRDILVPDLLSQMADYEILYPDLDTIKTILASWSRRRLSVWERIVKAANAEYDPIENYDRIEEWTDQGSSNGNANQYSAGFNAGETPEMVKQGQTDTGSSSTGHHNGRTHGNIGVTTSQQMLEQELAVAGKLDPYQYIINDFKRRFCVLLF